MSIKLSRAYGGVCLLTTLVASEHLAYNAIEYTYREETFYIDDLKMKYGEQNKTVVGGGIFHNGQPDDGNGRFSRDLGYEKWYKLSVIRRLKSNSQESIVTMAPLSLINGAFLPFPTMGLLSTYFVGRILYTIGYMEPEGVNNILRVSGAFCCHSTNFVTMLTTLYLGVQLSKGRLPHMLKKAAFKMV